MAELVKPIMLDETGQSIVNAIKDITVTFEGKSGMPMGGTTNQILQKKSNTNYDAEWVDNISLDGYAKTTDIPTKVSQLENDSGYLTEHQDISQLATKTEVDTKVSEVNTKVNTKSTVSIAKEGTTTSIARYIIVDGIEYKLPEGGGSSPHILTGISVTTPPTKVNYNAGETIDTTGIVVSAIYADNDNTDITEQCVFSPTQGTVIYEDTTAINISWENKGVTYTTTQEIKAARTLTEIIVTQQPTKANYELNEALDLSGMIITAIYNSGVTAVVTDYTTDPAEGYVFTKTEIVTLTITYSENGITKTTTALIIVDNALTLVDWASGTDTEIVAMVNAADTGALKLSDYWEVGQERTVSLPAMEATNVGETHAAQTVTLVLLNAGGKTLSNGKECSFIVGLKDCLNEEGYMNSSMTNSGSWESSARRKWCNNEFKTAMLSTGIGSIFKQHQNITAKEYDSTELTTSTDWFALAAAKEVFGGSATSAGKETGFSTLTEFNALTQFSYYADSSHRIKKANGSASWWWERSLFSGNSNSFGFIHSSGDAYANAADTPYALAPFGCI